MADELKRSCCSSHVNEWHTRPCTANGPVDAWHATSLGIASEALAEEELVGCAMEDIEVDGNDRVALPVSSGHCEVCGFAKVVCQGDHSPAVRGPDIPNDRFFLGGPRGVRRRHPEAFTEAGIDFGYYRTCCSTAPGSPHWQGCGTNFFARGQTVVKADQHWSFGPGRERLLLIKEDRVSSDRTFENETRPL